MNLNGSRLNSAALFVLVKEKEKDEGNGEIEL
jgi:hypothetical protein